MRWTTWTAAVAALAGAVAPAAADIYMHNPRGSNNRNCVVRSVARPTDDGGDGGDVVADDGGIGRPPFPAKLGSNATDTSTRR